MTASKPTTQVIETHYKSSMKNIRVHDDGKDTITITFIGDDSNGYRSFTLSTSDAEKLGSILTGL